MLVSKGLTTAGDSAIRVLNSESGSVRQNSPNGSNADACCKLIAQIVEDAPESLEGLLATLGKAARYVGKLDVAKGIDTAIAALNFEERETGSAPYST